MNNEMQPTAKVGGEVVISSITKFVGSGETAKCVISNCTMTINEGKLTVIIGPSGCGKTTLVNLIAGYESLDGGSISIDGKKIIGPSPDRLVVFQESALFPWMTTWENISYGLRVSRCKSNEEIENATGKMLKMVGLFDFKNKYPSQLSGGMQRRVELARAMINQPKIMIMDEPFRGLDAMTRKLMQEYYIRLFEDNKRTNLFVTSELDEAIILADKLVILTNRPTKIKKIINIEFPHPRNFSLLTSIKFSEYKKEALELLYEEAICSFASGSVDAQDFLDAYASVIKKKQTSK